MSQFPNLSSCFGLGTAHSIPTTEPLLFRLNGAFKAFNVREGSFIEFYPNESQAVKNQVIHGTLLYSEFFLVRDQYRSPPLGAITYRVRLDGTLQFLDENIHCELSSTA